MKKIIDNQRGVTLIETVVATAIITIILVTILGALLYGQKMIVFSDSKNNEAAQAQELIDEIMTQLSSNVSPDNVVTDNLATGGALKITGDFVDPKTITNSSNDPTMQYIINNAPIQVEIGGETVAIDAYNIEVRVYYNNNESYIDLKAFTKKGGVGV